MHARIAHLVAPDQLVLGVRIDVVLVAKEALVVLLGPARIFVLLAVFRGLLLPFLGRLAGLHRLIVLAGVALLGHRHDGGVHHLATTCDVALASRCRPNCSNSFSIKPAFASFSRNSHSVVPSGMRSSMPSARNRVNDRRSRAWYSACSSDRL